jgi:hypothetical protein
VLKIIGFSLILIDALRKKQHPLLILGSSSFLAYHIYQVLPPHFKTQLTEELSGTLLGKPVKKKVIGVRSIDDRVKHIKDLIYKGKQDSEIRRLATELVRDLPDRDYNAEIAAIANYVKSNVRFTQDIKGMDTYFHPIRTLESGVADCDDFSILLGSLFESIGHPVRLKVVQTKNASDFDHIYPLVNISDNETGETGNWIPVDLSVNKPIGWEVPKNQIVKERVFDV